MNIESFQVELKDKICVITGGGGVIGSSLALELSRIGLKVAIVDYKQDRCDACADKLSREAGKQVTCIVADVLDKDALLQGREEVRTKLGKIDFLINAAGGNAPGATTHLEWLSEDVLKSKMKDSIFGLDLQGFQDVFDLNVLGTVLPTLIFAEDMVRKGGSIINISSMSGQRPLTKVPAYSAAKSAIDNWTRWLAVHLAKTKVRVNAIAPGFILTNQNRFLLIDKESEKLTPRGEKIIYHIPMQRFGTPEDLLGAVLFLFSKLSQFITGTVLPIDGGFNAYSGV